MESIVSHDFRALQGHEPVKEVLRALKAHTVLFTGPQGVGRRLSARWWAAWFNCQQGQQILEPCGVCESCRAMLVGNHPDYREIFPERETKTGKVSRRPQFRISDLVVRSDSDAPLGPWLEQRPRYTKRVGVIDQAELLNASAANAFLKFLEEPPSYAVIVLIAPSSQAVLATVASRAVPVRFTAVPWPQKLEQEVLGEGLARLKRFGDYARITQDRDTYHEVAELVTAYVQALSQGLEESLGWADALEKRWFDSGPLAVPELLRAALSQQNPYRAAAALTHLDMCEEALKKYATPSLAVQVFTLSLRELWRDS